MLNKWLNQQKRHPPVYKFPVTDITELDLPDEQVLDYLALALLLAHANPQQIRDQYKLLHKDAEGQYVKSCGKEQHQVCS